MILRFLIARKFHLQPSVNLMKTALHWRENRKPDMLLRDPDWEPKMSKESETGKIYLPGFDRWGRPVLVLNNQVQNTNSIEDQMRFLAWSLELAIRLMPPEVDKYCIFIHLETFSFFNMPPFQSTRETLLMLCDCFPERLGHCIVYRPPTIFYAFFNTLKGFIDPKTVSKLVFVMDDVSEGSANDMNLRSIIGDNWKELTGAGQPAVIEGCSPGYDHAKYWPKLRQRVQSLRF